MEKHNTFSPDYYTKPDFDKEMERMHTSEYIASLDAEESLLDDVVNIPASSPESIQTPPQTPSHQDSILKEIQEGHFMHMGELTSLSVETARILSTRSFLDLRSVGHLSSEAASILGEHRGRLILLGLMSLEPGVAQALGVHEGFLDLSGITHLSLEDARALSYQKGDLRLTGLMLDFSAEHARESAEILDSFTSHVGEVILTPQLQKQFDNYKKQHQAA